ncbi:hypothetical protein BD626DRAFT_536131 [Schizophyllum amplum]|uniref:Uncharacterized protein n=1 Tax=Schizophyllum amplum TaxID=97359 RepID=A0A550CJH1_9AGAR|nr:hypothetical protein BD626DRAFT_536131 [Auriculariopsis ampla]
MLRQLHLSHLSSPPSSAPIHPHSLPGDLFKLDSRFRDKVNQPGPDSSIAPRTGSSKDYPILHFLLTPLSIYFEILTAFAATGGGSAADVFVISRGGFHYIQHIMQLHQQYEWTAVMEPMSFRLAYKKWI